MRYSAGAGNSPNREGESIRKGVENVGDVAEIANDEKSQGS